MCQLRGGDKSMTRNALIKLAMECHWRLHGDDYLVRGLMSIYPGDDPARIVEGYTPDETVYLRDGRQSMLAPPAGRCLLSDLRSRRHPWIIGPFSGKFFSLKTQRIWPG